MYKMGDTLHMAPIGMPWSHMKVRVKHLTDRYMIYDFPDRPSSANCEVAIELSKLNSMSEDGMLCHKIESEFWKAAKRLLDDEKEKARAAYELAMHHAVTAYNKSWETELRDRK